MVVRVLAPEGCSLSTGTPVFLHHEKPSLNANSTSLEDPPEDQPGLMWLPLYINIKIYLVVFQDHVAYLKSLQFFENSCHLSLTMYRYFYGEIAC